MLYTESWDACLKRPFHIFYLYKDYFWLYIGLDQYLVTVGWMSEANCCLKGKNYKKVFTKDF